MIKNFFDRLNKNEKSRDHLIKDYLDSYFINRKSNPQLSPHEILANVWLEFHRKSLNINNLEGMKNALRETFNFSCLPEPLNAKALAIWLAYKDMPALIGLQNEYFIQVRKLLKPVYIARKKGKIAELYKKINFQN